MIIQCDQCSTRFRLDDAKLSRGSAKVRCSKCKHVFIVPQEESTTEAVSLAGQYGEECSSILFDNQETTPESDFLRGADQSGGQEMADFTETAQWGQAGAAVEPESGLEQPTDQNSAFQEFVFEDASPTDSVTGEEVESPDTLGELDFSAVAQTDEAAYQQLGKGETSVIGEDSFVFDDFSADDEATDTPEVKAAPSVAATDDFAIDFGELAKSDDSVALYGNGAISDSAQDHDDLLAESLGLGKGATTAVPETTVDDFELSFGADLLDFGGEVSTGTEEKASDQGVADFGDLDFGELVTPEASVTNVATTLEPAVAASAEEAETLAMPQDNSTLQAAVPQADELPPLSIASRRKGTLFPLTIVGGAAVMIVALAGFGLYFLDGPNAFTKLIAGVSGSAEEEGNVSVRQVTGTFLRNKEAGEIFVIKGEAVNGFKKPRASIQVKATLYGANGQPLENKLAYCGNNITNEQLTSLPLAKIEEVMNNQFGDSLTNLGVQPGKVIPFVVVFTKVSKEAVDYGVQVAGSTVAAQ